MSSARSLQEQTARKPAPEQKSLSLHRPILDSEDAPPLVHEVLNSSGAPLDATTRTFFEPRFGHDFSRVRVHTDEKAAESARMVNARAYTVGENVVLGSEQYSPSSASGRRLLAHELTHVVQQSNSSSALPLMRDFALEPPADVPEQRELTAAQVREAIRFNRARYNEEAIRLIQDVVGADVTGTFDAETVRMIASMQREYGLVPADGKLGPDGYDHLIRELQAENVTPGACVTMFELTGPQPLAFFRNSPTRGTIGSHFSIRARFDPRCDCSDFEYRQFISGHVELLEAAPATGTPPARSGCARLISSTAGLTAWNMDRCFRDIPGGRLRRGFHEDGDTSVPAGTAGHFYGHRDDLPHATDQRDRYLPDRPTGCIYESFDFPEMTRLPAGPGDRGDVYDWQMRFRGIIQRRDGTVVSEKQWDITDTIAIP
jgi:peptidoglycan hydrolase-like protein with peptidoglycan-binding domain